MSRRDFEAATRLTPHQIDRFEAEGLLRAHYEKGVGFLIDNADEFIATVVRPAGAQWPPTPAVLDDAVQATFAADGGGPETARSLMEPFRYSALGDAWNRVVGLASPSVRLVAAGRAGPGASKLGGTPDVASTFIWPRFDGVPLGFVAQVNLADVQRVYPTKLLPDAGLLSFFYESSQSGWGFDPKDRGRWSVHHFDGPVAAAIEPGDLDDEGKYQPIGLRAVGEITLPEPDSLEIERLELTQAQRRAYSTLTSELEEARRGPIHRLMGWPEQVQHNPANAVQLPANGLYAGNGTAYASDEGKRLMAERDVWQLLFQVDSDDAAGMMWGDVGRLYYMIRRDDLAVRNWEACWFAFQCS